MLNDFISIHLSFHIEDAMTPLGFRLEDMIHQEVDAALGNGGLGTLLSTSFTVNGNNYRTIGCLLHGFLGHPRLPCLGLRFAVYLHLFV